MDIAAFGGIIRAVLAAAAGYLAGKGMIDQGMADQLVGAGVVVLTAIWSVLAKKKSVA